MQSDRRLFLERVIWEKYWTLNLSLLMASYLGHFYTRLAKHEYGAGFLSAVIISRKGHTSCYFDIKDRKAFALRRIDAVAKNIGSVKKFCNELKKGADEILGEASSNSSAQITKEQYLSFMQKFMLYNGLHITPRHLVDFLPPDLVNKYLLALQEVRVYTEKLHPTVDDFLRAFAGKILESHNIPAKLGQCLIKNELEEYFDKGRLPPEKELKKRFEVSAYILNGKIAEIETGSQAEAVERSLNKQDQEIDNEIKGQSVYAGIRQGKVKVIFDPLKNKHFNEGDILVTGMTRPEFLPLIKKAGAFVTDAGGILSHAAIIARELKKPCIIGTNVATKVLHDGDLVEVDADKGVVRILKKAK